MADKFFVFDPRKASIVTWHPIVGADGRLRVVEVEKQTGHIETFELTVKDGAIIVAQRVRNDG